MYARHRVAFVILLCLAVTGFVACTPTISEPEAQEATPPPATASSVPSGYPPPPMGPEPGDAGYPPPQPTGPPTFTPGPPIVVPTMTQPPMPTPLPTPQVTPVPTVSEIPELASSVPQEALFWIYGWRENTVWRMDSRSLEEVPLLDTMQSLGQPLADNVPLPHDEFAIGPVVAPAPTGDRIAVVTVAVASDGSREEHFTFFLSITNLDSGQTWTIGEGTFPTWSPDGSHIVFFHRQAQALWIADPATNNVAPLYELEAGHQIAEIIWAPDSSRFDFTVNKGMEWLPTVWQIDLSGGEPYPLFTFDYSMYGLQFGRMGTDLYFLATDLAPGDPFDLWSVSLGTGEVRRLTEGLYVGSYAISPDDQWILLGGRHLYEADNPSASFDLWLLQLSDLSLHRLTKDYGSVSVVAWLPESGHITALDTTTEPSLLVISLADLSMQRILLPADSNFTRPPIYQQ